MTHSFGWGIGAFIASILFSHFLVPGPGQGSIGEWGRAVAFVVAYPAGSIGWLVGTLWGLQSIFDDDFGEFRVCLTSEQPQHKDLTSERPKRREMLVHCAKCKKSFELVGSPPSNRKEVSHGVPCAYCQGNNVVNWPMDAALLARKIP